MEEEPKEEISKDIVVKSDKVKSKIEKAGENVMNHLMELAKNTDLSHEAMAKKINEVYGFEITKMNVYNFFAKNANVLAQIAQEQKSLSKIRADLFLEHNAALVKDIKILDKEIERLIDPDDSELLEMDKRAKAVGDLIDKKGRLLLRAARLSGKLDSSWGAGNIHNTQVNIYQQVTEEKSELINRLKKAEFKKKKVVDVEDKKTNSEGLSGSSEQGKES